MIQLPRSFFLLQKPTHVAGLLTFTGGLSGSRGRHFADRDSRTPAPAASRWGIRPGAPFHHESARPPIPVHRRHGFPDRPARRATSWRLAPPRPYIPRTLHGLGMFQDAIKAIPYPRALQATDATAQTGARQGGPRSAWRACTHSRRYVGRAGAARGPVNRGVSLSRVVVLE